MRPVYRIFARLTAVVYLTGLAGCQPAVIDDRALIQQRLQAMGQAAENHQARAVLAAVHEDFLGQGNLRKANLAGLLLLHFRQHSAISVRLSELDIAVDGEQATVTLTAQLHGAGGVLGQGRRLHIQSRWQKVDGEWVVERARWQNVN